MIELVELTRRYEDVVAVDAVSLTIGRGECVVLLGASGCGKTTTLKMINRLIEPSAGSVRIDGHDHTELPAAELRRRIGYGFQQVGLFPHWSVAENVGATPRLLGWSEPEIRARVDELLELVELAPKQFRERRPHELSGGQQQRVGLARALAARPEVLLLDEPFGALDPLTRDRLQRSFVHIREETGVTVVFVTHDMVEALVLGDRIAVLREGRLLQVGTAAELLGRPADPEVTSLFEMPRRHAAVFSRELGEGAS